MTGKDLLDSLRNQFQIDGLYPFGSVRGWSAPNHIDASGNWNLREDNSKLIITVVVDGRKCGLRFREYEEIDSEGDSIGLHEPINPNSLCSRITKSAGTIGLAVVDVRYYSHQQHWDHSVSYLITAKRPVDLERGPEPEHFPSRGKPGLGMWTPRPIRRGRYESKREVRTSEQDFNMNTKQLIESMIDDMLLIEAGATEFVLIRHLPSGQYQDITRVFAFDRSHAIFLLKRRGFHKVGTDQTLKVMSLDEYNDMYFQLALKAKNAGSKTPLRAGAYR